MVHLNEQERITLLMMLGYGDRRRTFQEACNLFNTTFPNRENISKSTVHRVFHNFERSGNVKDLPKSGRTKSSTTEDRSLDILFAVQEEPNTSVPKLALQNNISKRSVRRILKRNNMRPYKISLLQELTEDDPDRRMQFCQEIMNRNEVQEDFSERILFSDEATFSLYGFVNRHNCRYWSDVNPRWMEESHTQRPQKVNVWAGIIGNRIIGPYFIRENLTANGYLNLLRNHVVPDLINLFPNPENAQLIRNDIWLQQDGAPPHYGRNVREYLDEIFHTRWIGRRGEIEWPPRSPDLNPLDFFLWGHLKSVVYRTRPNTLLELEQRIEMEINEIEPQSLENVRNEFIDRLGYCQAVEGFQFEHLIK